MKRRRQARAATVGTLLLALAGVSTGTVRAQGPGSTPFPVAPMAMAGAIGSFAGLATGAMVGVQSGLGTDGEDSFAGALLLAGAGAVLGTAVGMKLADFEDMSMTKALGASVVGFAAGLAVSCAVAGASGDGAALPIVFSVSQGTVAALAAAFWRAG